jgi:hypothetical protein
MEKQTEKIMSFSKIDCILLNITIGVFIAIGVLTLIAWLLSGANLPTEIVTIKGVDMEIRF